MHHMTLQYCDEVQIKYTRLPILIITAIQSTVQFSVWKKI